MSKSSDNFDSDTPLHGYKGTRKDALRLGDLIDCSELADDAGFHWPMGITRAVFNDCVTWNPEDTGPDGEKTSQFDRLWTIAHTASLRVKRERVRTDRLNFKVRCLQRSATDGKFRYVNVKLMLVGHWDENQDPVLTVRYPPTSQN